MLIQGKCQKVNLIIWGSFSFPKIDYKNFNDQFGMYVESKKPAFKKGILFVPQRIFNAYPCPCCGEKYQAGDFLIHFVNHKRPFHNWAGDTKMNLPDIYKIPEIQVVRNPDGV